jgi:hypothetical protein
MQLPDRLVAVMLMRPNSRPQPGCQRSRQAGWCVPMLPANLALGGSVAWPQARKQAGATGAFVAAAVSASGYNSDEEVYATAKALDAAGDVGYDSDDAPAARADAKDVGPIPPLDHSSIAYDEFAKDFYQPAPEVAAMTLAEARGAPSLTAAMCSPSAPAQGICVVQTARGCPSLAVNICSGRAQRLD